MDLIKSYLTPQTIDMIFSDPLLSVGAILVVVGVFLFLLSAFKYLRYNKTHQEFAVPDHSDEEDQSQSAGASSNGGGETHEQLRQERPSPALTSAGHFNEPEEEISHPQPSRSARYTASADQTVVMPPGVADLQAQFEIAITQIKQLNKKIFEMERQIENLQNQSEAKLDPNELKEPPANPEDYFKKLLKVVEHVIVLEKEIAKIKSESTPSKSQIMPL